MFGTEEIVSAEGADLSHYRADQYYSQDQIDAYLRDLVSGRRKFTEDVAEEGLDPDILRAAEESYQIAPKPGVSVSMSGIRKKDEAPPPPRETPETATPLTEWKPNKRLVRDRGWRYG
jgi:hypothetical protein